MKNYMIGIMFVIACGTGGCEKDTFHDTGLADGVYDDPVLAPYLTVTGTRW